METILAVIAKKDGKLSRVCYTYANTELGKERANDFLGYLQSDSALYDAGVTYEIVQFPYCAGYEVTKP